MDSEATIYLIKDFPVAIPTNHTWTSITTGDVYLSEWDLGKVDHLVGVGAIRDFFQKLKKDNKAKLLLVLRGLAGDQKMSYTAYFNADLFKELGEIGRRSGSSISLIIRISPTGDGVPTLEKGFELKGHAEGFSMEHGFGSLDISESATCDILLEWTETREGSPGARSKKIKMSETSFINHVFESKEAKDLTVVAGNGAEIKCHRLIFTAHSSVLAAMLSPSSAMKEFQTGRVVMSGNSEEGVNLLIRYLYGMELLTSNLSCELALELFRTADMYELSHLRYSVSLLFLQKDRDWFTPEGALGFYFYVRNLKDVQKLEERVLSILSGMEIDQLKTCEGFRKLDPAEGMDLFSKLVKRLQKDKSGKVANPNEK